MFPLSHAREKRTYSLYHLFTDFLTMEVILLANTAILKFKLKYSETTDHLLLLNSPADLHLRFPFGSYRKLNKSCIGNTPQIGFLNGFFQIIKGKALGTRVLLLIHDILL